ncbi:MAG: serine/threonine-protein kinase, partial [Acidobacteriota bacterium]
MNSGGTDTVTYFNSLIGREINGCYRIEEKIGVGGMGAVFRAINLKQHNTVAVKVISPHLAANQIFIKRFQREARVGWALSHPNIIKVYEYGETEVGLLFAVMEFIEGETLGNYIDYSAPLTISRCLQILVPLCDALATAHARNILHRDLKPANVLLSRENDCEVIKLGDFGLVKLLQPDDEISQGSNLTAIGETFGTPHYMSPEQLMGHALAPTTDIYSLGVITYEMLTGRVPIETNDRREFLTLKLRRDLAPPSTRFPFLPVAL